MNLDYGILQSPGSIKLSLGTFRKPNLREIFDDLGYDIYQMYVMFIQTNPKEFYEKIMPELSDEWDKFDYEQKQNMTMFDIIETNERIREIYSSLFDFFIEEHVIYISGAFFVLSNFDGDIKHITEDDVKGIIFRDNFDEILGIIRQICCVSSEEEDNKKTEEKEPVFKNALAKKLWDKIKKGEEEKKNIQKPKNKNYYIPNIISSVASRHNSLNYTNIYELTMFQLIETFNRLRANEIYDISSRSVSVWGSKDNDFDDNLWYKNTFDSSAD